MALPPCRAGFRKLIVGTMLRPACCYTRGANQPFGLKRADMGKSTVRPKDIPVGQVLGKLAVMAVFQNQRGQTRFCWQCECGRDGVSDGSAILKRANPSCWRCSMVGHPTHGHARKGRVTKEWMAWAGVLRRCTNPNDKFYHRYGGRGIAVCDRWKNSFENFLADMGPRPSPKHSLDRIDNDLGYEPKNCRWATPSEQARNKATTRRLTVNGITKTIVEWAEIKGIKPKTLKARIGHGWDAEVALNTPVSSNRKEVGNGIA